METCVKCGEVCEWRKCACQRAMTEEEHCATCGMPYEDRRVTGKCINVICFKRAQGCDEWFSIKHKDADSIPLPDFERDDKFYENWEDPHGRQS